MLKIVLEITFKIKVTIYEKKDYLNISKSYAMKKGYESNAYIMYCMIV